MKLFSLSILLFLVSFLNAQNLVHNGSMEIFSSCPNQYGQLYLVNSWFNVYSSCDYFNSCDKNNKVGVPKNYFGYTYPYNGNAYIGQSFYSTSTGILREFSAQKMTKSLIKRETYCVSFFVQLSEGSSYGFEEISAYFTHDTLKYDHLLADTIIPQFVNNEGIISDTAKWNKISGSFTAFGGEQFITIGNFFRFRPVHTQLLPYGIALGHSYFFIDAVAVYPCDAPISTAQTINDTLICKGNTLSPGFTQVEPKYETEYEWFWYKSGSKEDTLSTEQFPVFQPDTTTSYVLKLTDFKYDITYDTVNVEVVDCKQPTSLKVYPNPTHDVVYFAFDSPIPQGLSIELYNLMGQKIKGIDYKPNKESKLLDINLQTLPTGIYFYRVLLNDKPEFKGKIIKI